MPNLSVCCNSLTPKLEISLLHSHHGKLIPCPLESDAKQRRRRTTIVFAAKSGVSILKRCQKCGGKGAIECPGCKGTGKNKKNGNIFERWKCFECQGFGLKGCPNCGKGGLTPEQRGER